MLLCGDGPGCLRTSEGGVGSKRKRDATRKGEKSPVKLGGSHVACPAGGPCSMMLSCGDDPSAAAEGPAPGRVGLTARLAISCSTGFPCSETGLCNQILGGTACSSVCLSRFARFAYLFCWPNPLSAQGYFQLVLAFVVGTV